MTATPVPITPELHAYLLAHSTQPDPVLHDLIEQTARMGDIARFQIAPEQGLLLTMLVQSLNARAAVEVGTFTGYSSIAIARGLAEGGTLLCCDVSEQWTAIAREAWQRAGVQERIELRLAPAMDTLRALPAREYLDFAFVDADKVPYWDYYTELVARLRPGGIIAFDNVFRNGDVVDSRRDAHADDPDVAALHDFNGRLAADPRVDVVMLPIADGLTLARKR